MIIAGIDVAAKNDKTAVTLIQSETKTVEAIHVLHPPVKWQTVLAFVSPHIKAADVVLLDASGVGAVVHDLLSTEHDNIWPVRFVGSDQIKVQGRWITAGKAGLVRVLHAALGGGLSLACDDAAKRALRDEMHAFRIVAGKKPGSFKYEAQAGKTDDVLMSAALAALGLALLANGQIPQPTENTAQPQ